MLSNRALTRRRKAWAYEKWCLGYTQAEIAEALHTTQPVVSIMLSDMERVRPKLEYKDEVIK